MGGPRTALCVPSIFFHSVMCEGQREKPMALVDFRSKNLTNRCYICICIRVVSGWQCVMLQLVEFGGIMVESADTVTCF